MISPNKHSVSCITCGSRIDQIPGRGRRRIFCSSKCKDRHGKKDQPSRRVEAACLNCGTLFVGLGARQYCTRECAVDHRFTLTGQRRKPTQRKCEVCATEFWTLREESRFCSVPCAKKRQRQRKSRKCLFCEAEFFGGTRGGTGKYCSRKCSFAAIRANSSKPTLVGDPRWQVNQFIKRAKRFGRSWERIVPSEVFERDGWACGICGGAVDKFLAWPHPLSASLDHVLPLSRGGNHTHDNVQCSHLSCNSKKGNRGQYLNAGQKAKTDSAANR